MTEPKIVEESTIGKETEGEETTQSEIDEESTIREENNEEETPKPDVEAENQIGEETSLPYFWVKLSCVFLMFAYRKTSNDL